MHSPRIDSWTGACAQGREQPDPLSSIVLPFVSGTHSTCLPAVRHAAHNCVPPPSCKTQGPPHSPKKHNTHLRRFLSTSSSGKHSRSLWGPEDGLGACVCVHGKWTRFNCCCFPCECCPSAVRRAECMGQANATAPTPHGTTIVRC